jgi:hypothetical protein
MRSLGAARAVALFVISLTTGLSATAGFAASLPVASQSLTPLRTCTVSATPSTTTSVEDAAVRQSPPSNNFGTATSMDVASGNSANRRIHVRFDLTGCSPAIPTTATVRAATLRLYVTSLPNVCRTLDIFRVATAWTETGITWNNQPFGTTLNNPASGSRTDSFDVGTPAGCENRVADYVSGASVTADVAAFVAGTTNNGWMIRDDTEGSSPTRTTTFSTKELATLAQAPQLVVTYVTAP